MSAQQVRAPEWAAGVAGLVLLVSLLLPWYAVGRGWMTYAPGPLVDGSDPFSAWEAFSLTDLVLALLALAGPALVAVQASRRSPALPVAMSIVGVVAGLLATLVVIARLLLQPGPNDVIALRPGAWIGLAGAVGLLAAAWWSLAAERSPGAPAPDVELRPAPPAAG